jgi:hypothetical protein
MRRSWIPAGLLVLALTASCSVWPTERDIIDSLDATLGSVSGPWTGTSTPNTILLEFHLQEGTNGQVSGTGTMKETGVATAVPITITGTFRRPTLSLTYNGLVYEGRNVQGTSQGDYTTVGGVSTTLQLTGTNYSRSLQLLLQER